jgi:hypothetical protein
MKPFNLEEAKAGKKIVTRGGTACEFLAHAPNAREDVRVVIQVRDEILNYNEDGVFINDGTPRSEDLFMDEPAPVTVKETTYYINYYRHNVSGRVKPSSSFPTRKEAKANIFSSDATYIETRRYKPNN